MESQENNTQNQPINADMVQPTPPPTKQGLGGKKIGLIIGGFIAILVLAGGVLGAALYMQQNNKPEKVLADALVNTASDILEKKPVAAAGSIMFESKDQNAGKISITFDSASSGENSRGKADVAVEFGGRTYNLKAEAAMFGSDEYYVKLENIRQTLTTLAGSQPGFSQYIAVFEPIISKVDNRWIKVTADDLKQFGSTDVATLDKCAAAVQGVSLSGSDKDELKKLFRENQFIVAGESFDSETIGGESSFHYKLDFNDEAAEQFAKSVVSLSSFEAVKRDCELTEDKLKESLDDARASGNESDVKPVIELWVGKKTRRPTKISVAANDKSVTLDFATEIKLDADNVTVEKPEGAVSVSEIQAEFQKIMMQSSGL